MRNKYFTRSKTSEICVPQISRLQWMAGKNQAKHVLEWSAVHCATNNIWKGANVSLCNDLWEMQGDSYSVDLLVKKKKIMLYKRDKNYTWPNTSLSYFHSNSLFAIVDSGIKNPVHNRRIVADILLWWICIEGTSSVSRALFLFSKVVACFEWLLCSWNVIDLKKIFNFAIHIQLSIFSDALNWRNRPTERRFLKNIT